MGDISAADLLAMTNNKNGFLEGNGIIILLLFLLFLGGGFGGFGNNASTQAFTRAEMQDGFNNQNTVNTLNNLAMGMNNGFNSVNMGLSNGFNGIAMNMNNGFNSVNSNLANLGFNMQQCCCDLKTNMGIQGDLTRQAIQGVSDLINANSMQDLRDRLSDKDRELNSAIFAASQLTQTKTLEDFILANKSST